MPAAWISAGSAGRVCHFSADSSVALQLVDDRERAGQRNVPDPRDKRRSGRAPRRGCPAAARATSVARCSGLVDVARSLALPPFFAGFTSPPHLYGLADMPPQRRRLITRSAAARISVAIRITAAMFSIGGLSTVFHLSGRRQAATCSRAAWTATAMHWRDFVTGASTVEVLELYTIYSYRPWNLVSARRGAGHLTPTR